MKKFRRNYTKEEELHDRFINSFQKGGFILEELFTTTDRDIFKPYLDMLTDPVNSGIHSSILVAYKEIPYDELVLQNENIDSIPSKVTRKANGVVPFTLTKPMMVRMYKCIYITNPVSFGKTKDKKTGEYVFSTPKKAVEIRNTLNRLNSEIKDDGYIIVDRVVSFLKNQLARQESRDEELKATSNDLFVSTKSGDNVEIKEFDLIIPILKNNGYYETNGTRRYPYLQEMYNYHKAFTGQVKFHVKETYNSENTLVDSYLAVGIPDGFDKEMFVIKQYSIHCFNPFYFLDRTEAYNLYNELITSPHVSNESKELLFNTFEHYEIGINERDKEWKNVIPTIKVKIVEDITVVGKEEEDEEEEEFDPTAGSKGYSTLGYTQIKSILMGYKSEKVFGYYGHINEYFLRTKIISSNLRKTKKRSIPLRLENEAKPLHLYATINQNPEMFRTSGLTHPLDVFMLLSFKKYIYFTPDPSTPTVTSPKVSNKERYRNIDTEYGLIDAITTKSEASAGIQASIIPYKYNKDRFIFRDGGNKK